MVSTLDHPDHPPIEGGYTGFNTFHWKCDFEYENGRRWELMNGKSAVGRVFRYNHSNDIDAVVYVKYDKDGNLYKTGFKSLQEAGQWLLLTTGDSNK